MGEMGGNKNQLLLEIIFRTGPGNESSLHMGETFADVTDIYDYDGKSQQ